MIFFMPRSLREKGLHNEMEPARLAPARVRVALSARPEGRPSPTGCFPRCVQYYRLNMVGWIFKENTRVEESARNQAVCRRWRVRSTSSTSKFKALSDDELRAKTTAWKGELAAITELPEQWAKARRDSARSVCRGENAARRLTDASRSSPSAISDDLETWCTSTSSSSVGWLLHSRPIAKWRPAKARRWLATLPLYLNALTG